MKVWVVLTLVFLVLSPFGCPVTPLAFRLRGTLVPDRIFDVVFWLVTSGATSLLALGVVEYCGSALHLSPVSAKLLGWGLYSTQLCIIAGTIVSALIKFKDILEIGALTCGVLGAWTAALSLIPISRCSPLLSALGIPVDFGLRVHAVLGRTTAAFLLMHAIGYVILWWQQGGKVLLLDELLQWNRTGVNNFAGVLAFGFLAIALLGFALGYVRRRSYEAFYLVHIIGFFLFTVFGAMHWSYFPYYLAPGLMFWISDVARRILDGVVSRKLLLLRIHTYEQANLVRLVIFSRENVAIDSLLVSSQIARKSGMSVYASVNIPQLAITQWHLFSVISSPASGGSALEAWVRVRGDWTSQLLSLGDETCVETQIGSISSTGWPRKCKSNSTILLIASGTGIVPLLDILSFNHDVSNKIALIWIIRHLEDLTILKSFCASGRLARQSQQGDALILSLRIHFTGSEDEFRSISTMIADCESVPNVTVLNVACSHRYTYMVLLSLHASSLVGMVLGAALINLDVDEAWPDWLAGAITLAHLTIGATCTTFLCALIILMRRDRSQRFVSTSAVKSVDIESSAQPNPIRSERQHSWNYDDTSAKSVSSAGWTSVSVEHGRPDLGAEIHSWAAAQEEKVSQMSVLASGGSSVVSSARKACHAVNRGKCNFLCKQHSIDFVAVSFDMSDL